MIYALSCLPAQCNADTVLSESLTSPPSSAKWSISTEERPKGRPLSKKCKRENLNLIHIQFYSTRSNL